MRKQKKTGRPRWTPGFLLKKGLRQSVTLEGPHQPDPAGTGVGAEAAGDALVIVGNIFIVLFIELDPADGAGGTDGFTHMTVTAGTAAHAAVSLMNVCVGKV